MKRLLLLQRLCWLILEQLERFGTAQDENGIPECCYCRRQAVLSWDIIIHRGDCPVTQLDDLIVRLENDIKSRQATIIELALWSHKEAS